MVGHRRTSTGLLRVTDRSALERSRSARPRWNRRSNGSHQLPVGPHPGHALRARCRLSRREGRRRQDGAHAPASRRRSGVAGKIGDRGPRRRVRSVGSSRRRRRGGAPMTGTLVLVATPIGNLGDLSPRAVATMQQSSLILCEDTRHSGKLLAHAGISGVRLAVCNEHTETERAYDVLSLLDAGETVTLITDAGTPGHLRPRVAARARRDRRRPRRVGSAGPGGLRDGARRQRFRHHSIRVRGLPATVRPRPGRTHRGHRRRAAHDGALRSTASRRSNRRRPRRGMRRRPWRGRGPRADQDLRIGVARHARRRRVAPRTRRHRAAST